MIKVLVLVIGTLTCFSACSMNGVEHAGKKATDELSNVVSIKALRQMRPKSKLTINRSLQGTKSYSSSLASYNSDGLTVYALINKPKTQIPDEGFPIIIFGHGFHPEPKKYGVSISTGKDWRPGDYYRGIPESYAEKGFVVVTPDYRGHNKSEGFEFTQTSYLASSYYARDVLHLLSGLSAIADVDLNKVYYLGHSMGGDVGLKVLLATNMIKAASLWAPVAATTQQQALYYGKFYDKDKGAVDVLSLNNYMKKIEGVYAALPVPVTMEQVDPIQYMAEISTPLMIHHARGDQSVPYSWSENLVVSLNQLQKEYLFHVYDSNNHLFQSDNRNLAVERDIKFFRAH